MSLTKRHATGLDYLETVTDLLERIRLTTPQGGVWEAADLQWAWRKDQHLDPSNATFWVDEIDRVVGAAVITDWGTNLGCDLIVDPTDGDLIPTMWRTLLDTLANGPDRVVEMSVRDDDPVVIALATEAGFRSDPDTAVSCWLGAADRPQTTTIADGYRLCARADMHDEPHHMIKRNGADVEQRLQECSLYDPSIDLFVVAPDGAVAAYGLFWPDPVTGVGLVEPMRTEDGHQGRGLARHILTSGVERLAAAGCSRMKITFMDDNPISGHVYLSSGFQPVSFSTTYRRSG